MKKCLECNEAIYYSRRNQDFCDDKCRSSFNNRRRKIHSLANKVLSSIEALEDLKNLYPNHFEEIHDHLHDIKQRSDKIELVSLWKCKQCGQIIFKQPSKGERCDYCRSSQGWIAKS